VGVASRGAGATPRRSCRVPALGGRLASTAVRPRRRATRRRGRPGPRQSPSLTGSHEATIMMARMILAGPPASRQIARRARPRPRASRDCAHPVRGAPFWARAA